MNAPQHPLISAYAARHCLPPSTRADGRLTVVVDQTYRVHLQPARDGWLAMSARLCALPASDVDRDRLVTEIGKLAAGMLARHAAACVVDPQGRAVAAAIAAARQRRTGAGRSHGRIHQCAVLWAGAVRRLA
ncbi:hypothetical protein WJ972_28840 [Achromobacter insuavis]